MAHKDTVFYHYDYTYIVTMSYERICTGKCRQTSFFPLWKTELGVELEFPGGVRLGVGLSDIPSDQVSSHCSNDIFALLSKISCSVCFYSVLGFYFHNDSAACHSVTSTNPCFYFRPSPEINSSTVPQKNNFLLTK